jgi:aminocarboxymuconate-semialdehyde decarboxylase
MIIRPLTVVDVHTHFIPEEFVDLVASGDGPPSVTVERREGKDPLVVHDNGLRYPVFDVFSSPEAKIAQMDSDGIDVSIVSIAPSLFLFWLDPGATAEVCRGLNEAAARFAADSGGRIRAMATIPMNDPEAAAAELRRASEELGLVGVEIGTSVGSVQLDAAELDPVFAAAEGLGMPVMLHPYIGMVTAPDPGLEGFHLGNVVGNPTESFIAGSRLIAGGVFDRHPRLNVMLVHGGGAFPYQLGRLDHAYGVREETSSVAKRPPLDYLDRFYFDTVVFDPRSLDFLIALAGPEHVLFGTDLPFDMADVSGTRLAERVDGELAAAVLGGNAARLYGL